MTDDELMEKLRASAPVPKEADDPAFWAAFGAGLERRMAARPRRRWPAVLAGALAAAAALLLLLRPLPIAPVHVDGGGPRAIAPAPSPSGEEELLPSEDPTELVGDLDLEQLRAVEEHFHGGV